MYKMWLLTLECCHYCTSYICILYCVTVWKATWLCREPLCMHMYIHTLLHVCMHGQPDQLTKDLATYMSYMHQHLYMYLIKSKLLILRILSTYILHLIVSDNGYIIDLMWIYTYTLNDFRLPSHWNRWHGSSWRCCTVFS